MPLLRLHVVVFIARLRCLGCVDFACQPPSCKVHEWALHSVGLSGGVAEHSTWRVGDLKVQYLQQLDGGGPNFGVDLPRFVYNRIGPFFERCFEFCAGPGFIGFTLLQLGMCGTLVLADVNPLAIRAVEETIRVNGLEGRVVVYLSNVLADIPASEYDAWDLVVSNPPHFAAVDVTPRAVLHNHLRVDTDWSLHKLFYAQVSRFLKPSGHIVFVENALGSAPGTFSSMLPPELHLLSASKIDASDCMTIKGDHVQHGHMWYMHTVRTAAPRVERDWHAPHALCQLQWVRRSLSRQVAKLRVGLRAIPTGCAGSLVERVTRNLTVQCEELWR